MDFGRWWSCSTSSTDADTDTLGHANAITTNAITTNATDPDPLSHTAPAASDIDAFGHANANAIAAE
ncbi:MAG: hypothetical protein SNJ57_02390 [Cyanobacteriota bacterium]